MPWADSCPACGCVASARCSCAFAQNIIKRQRQAIEKIRKENERLKEQLKAESQQNAAASDGNSVSVIAGLQEVCVSFRNQF